MIYLDTSALVKLIFEENESAALEGWLEERLEEPKVTSQLSMIELVRTCRRHDLDAAAAARQLLAGLDLIPLTADLVEQAALVGPVELRSLDAIHLASAVSLLEDVSEFVVYDARLRSAAVDAGFEVVAPA